MRNLESRLFVNGYIEVAIRKFLLHVSTIKLKPEILQNLENRLRKKEKGTGRR